MMLLQRLRTEVLRYDLQDDGRLAQYVTFESCEQSLLLKLLNSIETIDIYMRPITVTHIMAFYNSDCLESELRSGTDIVYSDQLGHQNVCIYSSMNELIDMVISISEYSAEFECSTYHNDPECSTYHDDEYSTNHNIDDNNL